MRRGAVLGIVMITPALLASGCGLFENHTIRVEVTGAGTAEEIFYSFPGQATTGRTAEYTANSPGALRHVRLPWSASATTGFGFVDVTTTATGPVSCTIIVDGRTVLRRHSTDDHGVQCHYSVQGS
ncbi:hypothetical protein [Gandjariella thermophila]|uniref:Lipoprotein n=1 Tax=Gandjariella thermophila TaxID=1931992 RepID=A0A4D4J017_9PSEU|nr:hypothetical protein [Gandjariella thermophila]GDY29841.1 hypothetical protein GTS_14740 [Gandjariella thermophila]